MASATTASSSRMPLEAFGLLHLPTEIIARIGKFCPQRLALPNGSLNKSLYSIFTDPRGIAARALRQYSSPQHAMLAEIQQGDLEVLNHLLLLGGVDVNAKTVRHFALRHVPIFPLELAVRSRNAYATVGFLISKGADPNIGSGMLLPLAARNGDVAVVRLLLEAGAGARSHAGDVALTAAAEKSHKEVLELLVASGANVSNSYAIIGATELGHVEIVRFLLSKGANAKQQGFRAFLWACRNGRTDMLEALLDGSSLQTGLWAKNLPFLDTPIRTDRSDILKVLATHTSTRSVFLRQKNHLFVTAAKNGSLRCVQLLLDGGDYTHNQDSQALAAAIASGKLEMVKFLLEIVSWDHVARDQLLVTAARHDRKEIVSLLNQLDRSRAESRNTSELSLGHQATKALSIAVKHGKAPIVRKLIQLYFPDYLDVTDLHSALRCAASTEHGKLLEMCLNHLNSVANPHPEGTTFQATKEDMFVMAVRYNFTVAFLDIFLSHGVSVNCRSGIALTLASRTRQNATRVLPFLLERGGDPWAVDLDSGCCDREMVISFRERTWIGFCVRSDGLMTKCRD